MNFQLARQGDASRLRKRIKELRAEKGSKFNIDHWEARPYTNKTALHYGCQFGHLDVVRLVLDEGANVEASGEKQEKPLHHCAL